MGFEKKLYHFGIAYEPDFLKRTDSYDVDQWRTLKLDYVEKMSQFTDLLNGTASVPNSPSLVQENSFVSSNQSIDIPILPKSQVQQHSIQIQTSILESSVHLDEDMISLEVMDNTTLKEVSDINLFAEDESHLPENNQLHSEVVITLKLSQKRQIQSDPIRDPPSFDIRSIASKTSRKSRSNHPSEIDSLFLSSGDPPQFQSAILNRIATKVKSSTVQQTVKPSPSLPPSPTPSESDSPSFTNSLYNYLDELKQMVSLNHELINKPFQPTPSANMPKMVDYSTSDEENPHYTPKPQSRKRKPVTPIEDPSVVNELDTTPPKVSTKRKRSRKATSNSIMEPTVIEDSPPFNPIEPLAAIQPVETAEPTENAPHSEPDYNSFNNDFIMDYNESIEHLDPIEHAVEHPIDVIPATGPIEPIEPIKPIKSKSKSKKTPVAKKSKKSGPIDTASLVPIDEKPSQQPTPNKGPTTDKKRSRRRQIRKSFIDNEWVDADMVSNKQMNVVKEMGDGEYMIVEEIEKTIHGVKRNANSIKPSKKKKIESVPFKIASTICKKPTLKQVKAQKDIYIDLKEQDNYHIGYVGLVKGTEYKGQELGNAVYIVNSGTLAFNDKKIAKSKDVLMVNKGRFCLYR